MPRKTITIDENMDKKITRLCARVLKSTGKQVSYSAMANALIFVGGIRCERLDDNFLVKHLLPYIKEKDEAFLADVFASDI